MAQLFGHKKLKVYQKGLEFALNRSELLEGSLGELPPAITLIAEQGAFSSTLLTSLSKVASHDTRSST